MSLYSCDTISSPSIILLTFVYVIRCLVSITASLISKSVTTPCLLIVIIQAITSFGVFSFSEHKSLDSLWGNIGITLSTRYTLVPLLNASSSNALFSLTKKLTSAIYTPSSYVSSLFLTILIASSKSLASSPSTVIMVLFILSLFLISSLNHSLLY